MRADRGVGAAGLERRRPGAIAGLAAAPGHDRGAFSAGGTTDMFARILSQGLAQKYGTPFVVDNRAGAGGNIGAAMVARAALASEACGQRGYPAVRYYCRCG